MPTPSKPCSSCGKPFKFKSHWNRTCPACHKEAERVRTLKVPRNRKNTKELG